VVIHRIEADSFHNFNGIPAFILPQFENISVTNGRVAATFCMSAYKIIKLKQLFPYLLQDAHHPYPKEPHHETSSWQEIKLEQSGWEELCSNCIMRTLLFYFV
jgi:hypothetical protein